VLEAHDRAGGRGHTIMASPDITFDLGCGWLHSADQNSFVPIAEQLGFEIDTTLPPWRERAWGKAFPQETIISYSTTLARHPASGTMHASYFPKMR
jgi:monoamine oxidase